MVLYIFFEIFAVLILIGAAWLSSAMTVMDIFEKGCYVYFYGEFVRTRIYRIINSLCILGYFAGAIILAFCSQISERSISINIIGLSVYCSSLIAQQILLDVPRRRWLKSLRTKKG
ncbi:MAG: hypothetical protein AUJ32_01995 [Parcubacteria group bacterium CG1_02_40_82]|uniref:Uncharacterized protein n=4 Tax=Candidatus Portnoyibacteriota TaxID=1817913 RepID=A0A2M7III1_9BACT|nr:MAG: hypothetical protein AUJ32_01995 [Parcubacteria group bacterium CG1_02_40_82]PIQ75033.1 MAG: hypothetical protein COV84_03380 [Candidatus Portnoybacteria bacterium CG11_big_fil_rev_8_21_14_0_20_40_15]PIS30157.1 MAG: hypothetical protein COT41_03720 [Candidatus Portnoybacteria bacterium CG08_land_8_20_14_0_20_40_83]PIW76268.1 MAG: hypothetical protein CO001_02225 [Candidatus Portnoybacteria bacterium CG_4_8_14_3_um_filter_40_10]PIY74615.1 MAG: hypothetical protein COY85_02715 [Candidatus